jgi:hypothetical protein
VKRRGFLVFCGATFASPGALAQASVEAMRFSALRPGAALPAGFRHFAFSGQARSTEYTLVEDGGRTVLRARADESASGIVRELRVDPRRHPVLAWQWKVMRVLEKSDLAKREGDDFPARLYVTFDVAAESLSSSDRMRLRLARMLYGPDVPVAALCYVWDTKAPAGTLAANVYTDRVRTIVVDSGEGNAGRWRMHERNIVADFRTAFGGDAPMVNGVIVSTDTDNTAETAETYYGDVEFRAR